MVRLACVVSMAVVLGGAALAQGPPASPVRMDEARLESLASKRGVTGELRAVRRALIAAEREGRVVEIAVDEGDSVESGRVLARLDDRIERLELERLEAERDSARARVTELETRVAKAERDVERLEAATTRGGVSESELEDAKLDLQAVGATAGQARAALASVEAQIRLAEEEIAKMTISAPFGGHVVAKGVEVGEWVSVGGAVVELVDLSRIDAWLDVPERYVSSMVSTGSGVSVRVEALGYEVESSSVVVIASGEALSRTFPVRVRLENPEGVMRPGMSVTGLVSTGQATEVLTVHKDAMLRDDAGTFVYVDMGGQAIPARVKRLWAVGDRVVVESGMLRPGVKVVVEGNERLYPTAPIVEIGAGAAEARADERGDS